MKIAVYGTGNTAKDFMEELEEIRNGEGDIEILYFTATKKSKENFWGRSVKSVEELDFSGFDYLVVATTPEHYREIMEYLCANLAQFNRVQAKVIHHSEFYHYFIKEFHFDEIAHTVEGLQYIYEDTDLAIGQSMKDMCKTFAKEEIHSFFELTDLYYGKKERKGIFLDIGGNIGTTSIFVKKRINPELRVIAFEPDKRNYDHFRVNCILNHVEDIEVVPAALGDKVGNVTLYDYPLNSGGRAVGDVERRLYSGYIEAGEVSVTTLDDYLAFRNISAQDIDYIWMDAEGYESRVIRGAAKTLQSKRIPLIQEFNPTGYHDWDRYVEDLRLTYDNFIIIDEAGLLIRQEERQIYSVLQLMEYAQDMKRRGIMYSNLFFF